MDSSSRKRKRSFLKPTHHFFFFFSLFAFLFIIFRHNSFYQQQQQQESIRFQIADRVVFPDHILLLLSTNDDGWNHYLNGNGLQCVYNNPREEEARRPVLSVDEYNHMRWLVRCPLPPPPNFSSAAVTIRGSRLVIDKAVEGSLNSWENLAYEALLDRNTVLVFVKGISHRQNKESDPNRFTCHFRSPDEDKHILTSTAITAAQEVVRCGLPTGIQTRLQDAHRIQVTVSFRVPRQDHHVIVPSVAKIFTSSKLEIKRPKHELCVCTMLWNQADTIREWITYHSWLGVQKWFIYDNNSDDQIREVIKNLHLQGFNVTRHVWPWIKTQEAGFSHCAIKAKDECNWVSFMDVDEFYYFPKGGSLTTLVSNYTSSSSIGELRTSCHSFGPSGLTSPPKQGITVGYTCRLQSPERHKSIIRPDALDTTLMNVVHHFHLREGFRSEDVRQTTAVINHYKYQVWETFRAKFHRRVATYVADWQDNHNEGSRDRAPGLGTEAIEPPDWRLRFCEVWILV